MPRFFLPQQSFSPDSLILTGDAAAHARVLRLKAGEQVTVCDGSGTDALCCVSSIDSAQVVLRVLERRPSAGEPALHVSVFMAYAKSDKLEHVIQKATELGAAQLIAFPSARCVSRPDAKSLPKKLERWQKIAASAAEQSGRGRIPQVSAVPSFAQALELAASMDLAAFLYEKEQEQSFRSRIAGGGFRTAAIMTGPEGGFDPAEADAARKAGLQICTLGPRILRCETAPLCALTALMFACGELD